MDFIRKQMKIALLSNIFPGKIKYFFLFTVSNISTCHHKNALVVHDKQLVSKNEIC